MTAPKTKKAKGRSASAEPSGAITEGDARLWSAHDAALRSARVASEVAERVAASIARQRAQIEAAAERGSFVAGRSDGARATASRISEAFDRLGVVALNAGLEGARLGEPHGRALLLLSEEIRANVTRGAEAARELAQATDEIAEEASGMREQLAASRTDVAEVVQQAAALRAEATESTRALEDLASCLQQATGVDGGVARAVREASEQTDALAQTLKALRGAAGTKAGGAAIRPLLAPLRKLLGQIEDETGAAAKGSDGAS